MYRDTSSVDCAPRELTHACSRSDTEACDMCYVFNVNLTDSFDYGPLIKIILILVLQRPNTNDRRTKIIRTP